MWISRLFKCLLARYFIKAYCLLFIDDLMLLTCSLIFTSLFSVTPKYFHELTISSPSLSHRILLEWQFRIYIAKMMTFDLSGFNFSIFKSKYVFNLFVSLFSWMWSEANKAMSSANIRMLINTLLLLTPIFWVDSLGDRPRIN